METGTYNLVLLAGESVATEAYLYGSSYKEDVVIEQNKRTTVDLTILTVDSTLTAPEEVIATHTFEFTLSGNTRNPYLKMGSGTSYYIHLIDGTQLSYYG